MADVPAPSPRPLSPRMVDCLQAAATGLTDEGIATSLGISRHTVVTTLYRARKRLGVTTTKAAVAAWLRCQEADPKTVIVHLATDDRECILCTGEPWPASRGEHQPGTLLRQCPDCHREVQRGPGWSEASRG